MRAFPTTITLLRPARMAGYSIYNPVEPIIKKGVLGLNSSWLQKSQLPATSYLLPATSPDLQPSIHLLRGFAKVPSPAGGLKFSPAWMREMGCATFGVRHLVSYEKG